MPQKYKKRPTQLKWTMVLMNEALDRKEAEGLSWGQLLKAYPTLTSSTVREHWKARLAHVDRQPTTGGRGTALAANQEQELASCIRDLTDIGFAPTAHDILGIVQNYVAANETECATATKYFGTAAPGADWLRGFMKRKRLSMKNATKLSVPRHNAVKNPFIIYNFYSILEKTIAEMGIADRPDLIWNVDETGFPDDPTKCSVISGVGQKTVQIVAGAGRDNTTVVVVVSAAGKNHVPMIIFKGQRVQLTWRPHIQPGEPQPVVYSNSSGWIDSETFLLWIQDWEARTRSFEADGVTLEKRLLIFDGHLSHLYLETLRFARGNSVWILKLPPHTTELLQPADVSVMKALKDYWSAALTKRLKLTRSALTKREFGEHVAAIWNSACSEENVKSGFRRSGIYPTDRTKYPRSRFDPLLLRDYETWLLEEDGDQATLTFERIEGTEREPANDAPGPLPVGVEDVRADVLGPSSSAASICATPPNRVVYNISFPASFDINQLKLPPGAIVVSQQSVPSPSPSSSSASFREAFVSAVNQQQVNAGLRTPAPTKRRKAVNPHGELVTTDAQFAAAEAAAKKKDDEIKAKEVRKAQKEAHGKQSVRGGVTKSQKRAAATENDEELDEEEDADEVDEDLENEAEEDLENEVDAFVGGGGRDDDDDALETAEARLYRRLYATWGSLQAPVAESELIGKWYAGLYRGKQLYIGKVEARELYDVDGPVTSLRLRCLKRKTTRPEFEKPFEWPSEEDTDNFYAHDIIAGPLDQGTLGGRAGVSGQFSFPDVVEIFGDLKKYQQMQLEGDYNHRFPKDDQADAGGSEEQHVAGADAGGIGEERSAAADASGVGELLAAEATGCTPRRAARTQEEYGKRNFYL